MVVPFEVRFLYKICFTSLSKNWKNNNKSHFSTFTPAVCLLFWQYWCDQTLGAVAFCQDWVETNGEGFMPVIIWYSITANILPSASFYNKSSNKFLEITEKRLSALPSNVNFVIMIGDKFCGSALVSSNTFRFPLYINMDMDITLLLHERERYLEEGPIQGERGSPFHIMAIYGINCSLSVVPGCS